MNVLAMLQKDLQKELKVTTSKRTNSCLHQQSTSALKSFSWTQLESEVESNAPTLHHVLRGLLQFPGRNNPKRKAGRVRDVLPCQQLSSLQSLCCGVVKTLQSWHKSCSDSLALHSGQAGKQVCYIHNYIHMHVYMCKCMNVVVNYYVCVHVNMYVIYTYVTARLLVCCAVRKD